MRFSFLCRLVLVSILSSLALAQTSPTPFDLSTGAYSFTQWDATNTAGTYPNNMRFHMYSTSSSLTTVEPLALNYEMNSDWDVAYNLTSGARILGSGVDGVSFLNTSSSTYTPFRFFGTAVVSLKTTNRVNVRVDWTGGTVATQPRQYAIVLQYRVGSTDPWITAIQNVVDTVQYKTNTVSGHSQAMPTFTLPAACENQPEVQLRWRYYQWSTAASGNRPQLRIDNISVQSDASSGLPTKLAVSAINPSIPSALTPFSLSVQTVNTADQAKNVSQNTDVVLSLFSGSGALTGTLSGTIAAGTNTLVISNLLYSVAEQNVRIQVSRVSGDFLNNGISAPFTVLPRASLLTMSNAQANAFVGVPLSAITVSAQRTDNSIDLNYVSSITISKLSGPGNVTGTLVKTPVNGVVSFSDLSFDAAGTYVLSASGANVSSVNSTSIVVVPQPNVVELIMPQYMAGRSITLPTWALIRLDNLQPNTAYRFFTSSAEVNNLVGFAAGTNVHQNADASTFSYVANSFSDFATQGRHSQFSTGANQTSRLLWVNMVPSSNSRFTAGNNMFWYLTLRDTTRSIETRFVTTGTTKALNISTAAGDATGISDTASTCDPKTVICLYDNTTGSGSPLSTALVQDDAATVTGAPAFYASIESTRTGWATLIPNTLANGVRRVEQRSLTTGNILNAWVDDDGVWSPVNTVNVRGGNAAVIFPTPQVKFPLSLTGKSFCSTQPAVITWTSRGIARVDLQISTDGTNYTTFASGITASLGTYSWTIPDALAGGNNLRLRIVDADRPTTVFDVTGFVNVNTPAVITVEPISQDGCLGGSVTLVIQANGSALTYQWEKDGVIMNGRTGPVLTISSITQGSSGLYRVLVNGGAGCPGTSSKYAIISTLPELSIVQQPKSVSAPTGGTVIFTVEPSVQGAAQYQWYRGTTVVSDNSRISGSRTNSLIIRNISSSDFANNYNCRVVTVCGSITSDNASISSANISILQHPQSLKVCVGGDATFSALASTSAGAAVSYQWLKDGNALSDNAKYSGSKTLSLTVKSLTLADTGKFSCKATTANGAVAFTNVAILTTSIAPKVTSQSGVARKCSGEQATLSVVVADTTNVTYQWSFKSAVIAGATNANYVVNVNADTFGSYVCVVRNDCGADSARGCSVELIQETKITTQPRRETKLLEGGSILLSVDALASKIRYQWFHNGKAIAGDTLSNLSILNAKSEKAGVYTCVVSGECGTVTSDSAFVLITSDVQELAAFGFSIDRAVPNPVSELTTLQYELQATKNIQLSLCDFLGRPVLDIFSGVQEAGKHSIALPCNDLNSGTYFVILRSGNAVVMKRLAVVH